MSRTLSHRLARLEQRRPAADQRVGKRHRLIAYSRAEMDAKIEALKASPEWSARGSDHRPHRCRSAREECRMSRAFARRLERLEKAYAGSGSCHALIEEPGEDDKAFECRLGALKTSLPDYQQERDTILCVRFVSVEQVQARRVVA